MRPSLPSLPVLSCACERRPAGPSLPWVGLAFLLVLAGCGETKTQSKTVDHSVTKTETVHKPTADGGWVERTVTTRDGTSDADSVTRTEADASAKAFIGAVAPVVGTAISAATGTPGLPWGEILSGAAVAAATGWAALKHGQAGQLRQERDFHKTDADTAYKKLGVG